MKTNRLVLGLVAHVDAGKTTLAERLLYTGGSIRSVGRVDHRDTLLDHNEIERKRGITVFAKQAGVRMGEFDVTVLDTPGHVDFAAEMERTLQVLDYAILVISGTDGVQVHTKTIWKLLEHYKIPTFVFVNKMDQPWTKKEEIQESLQEELSEGMIDFSVAKGSAFMETLGALSEELMEEYFSQGKISTDSIRQAILQRKIIPCYYGSALKGEGTDKFFTEVSEYICEKEWGEEFGARVFKIGKDKNSRLTYAKITGGFLKVKTVPDQRLEEKVDQIRIYSGPQYQMVNEVFAGSICVLTGLSGTKVGDVLGAEQTGSTPMLEPVLSYQILGPKELSPMELYRKLSELSEEEPMLRLQINEELNKLHASLMGEVQVGILTELVRERLGIEISFQESGVRYKETVAQKAYGIGELRDGKDVTKVCLMVEPVQGAEVSFERDEEDTVSDRRMARMILTNLAEGAKGVIGGFPLTGMRVVLKYATTTHNHMEFMDFRVPMLSALREALIRGESHLAEPYYSYELEVPGENVGRAIHDMQSMNASFQGPEIEGQTALLRGRGPVKILSGYATALQSYTQGKGRFLLQFGGYDKCLKEASVLEELGLFLPEQPIEEEVQEYYVEQAMTPKAKLGTEEELKEIFDRTYKKSERKKQGWEQRPLQHVKGRNSSGENEESLSALRSVGKKDIKHLSELRDKYLLVDGYNIIFAWEKLKSMANENLEAARMMLADELCNYQGFTGGHIILVYDGYKVKGNPGEVQEYNNIHIVYTKEAETADTYIEKVSHEMGKKYRVTVATSDGAEQRIIFGNGATRMSALELQEEIARVKELIRERIR